MPPTFLSFPDFFENQRRLTLVSSEPPILIPIPRSDRATFCSELWRGHAVGEGKGTKWLPFKCAEFRILGGCWVGWVHRTGGICRHVLLGKIGFGGNTRAVSIPIPQQFVWNWNLNWNQRRNQERNCFQMNNSSFHIQAERIKSHGSWLLGIDAAVGITHLQKNKSRKLTHSKYYSRDLNLRAKAKKFALMDLTRPPS